VVLLCLFGVVLFSDLHAYSVRIGMKTKSNSLR
jgi:hypothetical protein